MSGFIVGLALVLGSIGLAALLSYKHGKAASQRDEAKEQLRDIDEANKARADYDSDSEFRDKLHDRFRR